MFDAEQLQPREPKARPVIGWPGGKTRMLKHLLPLVPEHALYVEVFGGGLALFLAKAPSDLEVVNDVNGDLVSFYRTVKYHLDPLLDELDLVLNSREDFQDYKEQRGLTEIQRAARWFIRNKLSFGGMGQHFGSAKKSGGSSHSSRSNRLLAIRALNRRFDKTCIERLPWEKCVEIYDHEDAFFFFDPPYFDSGSGAYDRFSELDLQRIRNRLEKLRGRWLLTFQDHEVCRDLFSGFAIRSIARPKGIENRAHRSKAKTYRELIITSDRVVADFRKGVVGA